MKGHDENEPEPAFVARIQMQASLQAGEICSVLRQAGYDYVLVSLGKRVEHGGVFYAPGATLYDYHPKIAAALGNEADALRRIAKSFDADAKGHGNVVASYVKDEGRGTR